MKRVVSSSGRISIPNDIAKLFGGQLTQVFVCREYGSDALYIANKAPECVIVRGKNRTDVIIGVPDICKENRISLPTCTRDILGFEKNTAEVLFEAQRFISSAGDEYFKVYLRATK